jgi:hypothetical protein
LPRYHFNVHGSVPRIDAIGRDLPDLDAARGRAVTRLAQLMCDYPAILWSGGDWRLDVADEGGNVLATLNFSVQSGLARPSARRALRHRHDRDELQHSGG